MVFVGYKLKDNAQGQLLSGCTDSATAITLKTGHGAFFPTLTGGQEFLATLIQFDGSGFEEANVVKRERIRVTARSGDSITVVRGDESDTPLAFAADDYIFLTVRSKVIQDIQTEVVRLETDKLDAIDHNTLRTGLGDWVVIYTDADGDEVELPLGADGTYLKSNGIANIPSFAAPPLDIEGQTTDNGVLAADDYIAYHDESENAPNKRLAKAGTAHEGLIRFQTDPEAAEGVSEAGAMNSKQVKDNYTLKSNVVVGTVTFDDAANGTTMNIAHGLGKVPRSIIGGEIQGLAGATIGSAAYDGSTITQKVRDTDGDTWRDNFFEYSPNSDTDR